MKPELAELITRYRRSPEFLFRELSDVNQRGMSGDTLLHAAAVRGDAADVETLLAYGASVDVTGDLGNTPLHYAASRGFDRIVEILLLNGANCSLVNEFGQTALDLAKLNRHHRAAKRLQQTK